MFTLLLVLLIIVSVLMIGLILLQKSEGSGMSGSSAASMFGGALTGAAAGNFLTRAIFFILCALLALVASKSDMAKQGSELRQELVEQGDATAQSVLPTDGVEPESIPSIPETK